MMVNDAGRSGGRSAGVFGSVFLRGQSIYRISLQDEGLHEHPAPRGPWDRTRR